VEYSNLYPFKSNYFNINGLNYHYLDEGAGSPMLMLHGNPTWSFYYRDLVKVFSKQFRTIVPDHIGCGLSDKPDATRYDYQLRSRVGDLEALLEHLNIRDNITLIVHDWGGMIGSAYAVKYPERIRRMIILNTAAFFPPRGKRLPIRLWLIRNLKYFAAPAVLGLNLFSRAAVYMASYKGLSEAVKAGLTAPYDSPKNRIATLKFVQDIPLEPGDPSYELVFSVQENLHRLKHIPKLILWGKHDFVFDSDYLAEWRKRFPDAEAHCFSDAGHYILEDKPDDVIRNIQNFLTHS
jgi:haloalkane dehalogenase